MGADNPHNRFRGVTNNGASYGDEGRFLRSLYHQHGLTPPVDLGVSQETKQKKREDEKRNRRAQRKADRKRRNSA